MPYHYKESGLDDVVLYKGYSIRQTPYGKAVAIHDVDAVHRDIAAKLVRRPHLTGAELRFLRLEMDQTQAETAAGLGTSEQTLSLWERARKQPIPATAAKLLQLITAVRLAMSAISTSPNEFKAGLAAVERRYRKIDEKWSRLFDRTKHIQKPELVRLLASHLMEVTMHGKRIRPRVPAKHAAAKRAGKGAPARPASPH